MVVAAGMAGIFGVAVLYGSWRKWLQARSSLLTGWLLIALSFWLWTRFAGAEFGLTIASVALPIIGWIFVVANRHVRRDNGRRQQPQSAHLPPLRAILRHAGIFLLAVPLAACCSTFLVLATARLLPWDDANRLAFAILTVPLAWGVLAYWACADRRPLRPAMGLVAGASAAATLLYI